MRAALLMALLAACAAQARDRKCRIDRTGARIGDCVSYAFFEAFPASGAGTSGACSTTAPTGAKGEVLTFTRTGDATCSKQGLATTGIANGDLVVLSGNQPRVELDSQGVLGLRLESSRVNYLQRSEEFDASATWTLQGVSASVPVVSANAGTAPDGTTTAERVQFGACSTNPSASAVYQVSGAGLSVISSVYVKGYAGTSGSISICNQGTLKSDSYCTLCAYNGATWTRCIQPVMGNSNQLTTMGCNNNTTAYNGSGDTGAADVLLWGASAEQVGGAAGVTSYVTSYIPTTSAAVTRNAESASFAISALTVSAPWSAASTTQLPTVVPTNARVGGAAGTTGLAVALYDSYASGGVLQAFSSQVTPNNYSTGLSVTANTTARYATYHDGTLFNGCVNASCAAGVSRAWTNLANVTTISVGTYSGSGAIDGIQSRICFQPGDAARCR
jgi:hypothetical protein